MNKTYTKFEIEAFETLHKEKDSHYWDELTYFFSLYKNHFSPEKLNKLKPKIIALGDDLPCEILYAFSKNPFYVLGGSLETSMWADEVVPRDTDPLCKSALGFFTGNEFDISKKAIIVTAITNDNRRKMLSILHSLGKKTYALDIPPNRDEQFAIKQTVNQYKGLIHALERHTGRRLTLAKLQNAYADVFYAREALNEFSKIAKFSPLSSPLAMMVERSLYYTDNLQRWTAEINKLNSVLSNGKQFAKKSPVNVILTGSPVVFPNYKIPELIASSDMNLTYAIDSFMVKNLPKQYDEEMMNSVDDCLTKIASENYHYDISQSFIKNTVFRDVLSHYVKNSPVDGIVMHILKGQIEYDFELPYIEKIAEEMDIPIFRLETDYSYQDIEQLRIRMEAFSEMLKERRKAKVERSA